MKSFVLFVGGLLVLFFAGGVQSSHYRGGTFSYRPNSSSPYSVDFTFRLSFRRSAVFCDNSRVTNRSLASNPSFTDTWQVTRHYSSHYSSSYSGSANIYCSDFNIQEDWSEGNNTFTFHGGPGDNWWDVIIKDRGNWIHKVISPQFYNYMQLKARVNRTVSGAFNNSSPISNLPLTVYVAQGIPSVIRIPVEDPDGDIVRCRKAAYQECYRGMCTYFPHGVLDERNCTLSYNGAGSVGQFFPVILKLEDFSPGTTEFGSSNSLGSVDLQFVVHVNSSDFRIQGGGTSGRLQILHNGIWGTVCDDGWSMTNTHVACRQLGFPHAVSYTTTRGGRGPIWLDDVRCSGNESAIQQCRHNGWGSHNCRHDDDVLVRCYPSECSNYAVLNTTDRAAGYRGTTNKCDRYNLTPGWYRFMGGAGTAMPTWCVDSYHCGTYVPGWMQGSHPTQAEGVVTRRVCYNFDHNCCWASNNIRVRNCGGHYVYKLVKPPHCTLRYCGDGNDNNTCASSPCRNGGTCASIYAGYRCYCPYGYNGSQCETLISTVRIQGGGSSGRLQVLHNGIWGTVCDDYWTMTNTRVVCRQLGFTNALSYTTSGGGTGPIWLDNVRCSGGESAIHLCTHRGWGVEDCSHSEDVFVTCLPSATTAPPAWTTNTSTLTPTTTPPSWTTNTPTPTPISTVRIQGGGSYGRLQVLHNGIWGTVCDDYWTMTNTHVVCRQLGFAGGLSYTNTRGGTGPIWLDNVQCSGSESAIQQCRHWGWGNHNCGHFEDVFVRCLPSATTTPPAWTTNTSTLTPTTTPPAWMNATAIPWPNTVRIQGGGSSGRLQVLHNGVWGTVCDDGWTMTNTHVVCRQLGFTGGLSWQNIAGGTGPIWLDDVRCSGNESAIQQCRHWGWGIHNCGHVEDIFVSCLPSAATTSPAWRTSTANPTAATTSPAWRTSTASPTAATTSPAWRTSTASPTAATTSPAWRTSTASPTAATTTSAFTTSGSRSPSTSTSTGTPTTMNLCHSRPCLNGGTCYGGYGWYYCICRYGYTGRKCQTSTTTSSPWTTNTPTPTPMNLCYSRPCRNGGTCYGGYSSYYCFCRYGYTGRQCQTYMNFCASEPCRNGGTCNNNYYSNSYQCSCPYGFTGRQCETNRKTSVTCGENFMQIDLLDQYFPGLDWRTLHLKNTTCRATKTPYTMRLLAPLDGCGVTYIEHDKKIAFWNEVRDEPSLWLDWGGENPSPITQHKHLEHLSIPFYCEFQREKIFSTSFSPPRKIVHASEESYGNFTFTMDLHQSSSYRKPYSPFAYPVVVSPNQPLYVQYEVKKTNADLVVFAENCRATPSANPDSFPQHVFLKRGCVRDPTMIYWYNSSSSVQRFSITSFSFMYSNISLVYLHCELRVCHRNSTSSRCSQGCVSPRKRREAVDGSNSYGLSVGPMKAPITQAKSGQQGAAGTSTTTTAALIGTFTTVAVVALLVAVLLLVKMVHARRLGVPPKTPPPAIVMSDILNSYEQYVMEDGGERVEVEI